MADWLDGYFENKPIVDATVNPADGGAVVEDGTITNAKLAAAAANTIKANATSGSLAPADLAVAVSRVVGRGPTGNIDDLTIGAGLVIADTSLGRAAFTGDVSAAADSNTLVIGADKVVTAMILDANVTTNKIALNAVGNQRMAQMATNTVKGNATGSTANSQDMTISGGLYTDGTSVLKSKSGAGWHFTYNTGTSGDPLTGGIAFNDVDLADITTMRIHNTTLGGRSLDTYWDAVLNGRFTIKSNNASGTAFLILNVSGVSVETGSYKTISVAPLAGVGVMPTNGEEVVVHYEAIGNAADVMSVNTVNKVLRRDNENNIIDENGTIISGSATVANYAALVALDTTTYADFAIKVTNGLNKSIWSPNGSTWLPVNGWYMHDRSNVSSTILTTANAVTWTASDSGVSNGAGGTYTLLTGTAHGLTAASVGAAMYLTNSPAGWTTLTLHTIQAYVDANSVRITTPWVAGMGANNPVFNTTTTYAPIYSLTVPVLRANTVYHFEATFKGQLVTSSSKVRTTLGATVLQTWTATTSASNSTAPFRSGFMNKNSVSSQEALYGASSSGFAASGNLATPAEDTSTGSVIFLVELQCNTVDTPVSLTGYRNRIEG